jgi:hypothetical protein
MPMSTAPQRFRAKMDRSLKGWGTAFTSMLLKDIENLYEKLG